jgi:hypothetical protein
VEIKAKTRNQAEKASNIYAPAASCWGTWTRTKNK